MCVNLVAVSIGNSRTQIGLFADRKLESRHVVPSDDQQIGRLLEQVCGPSDGRDTPPVLLASVNPTVEKRVMAQMNQRGSHVTVHRVEKDCPVPIGRQLDRETIVGVDRLLNAAAAYDVLKQACVVVDAGTAITIDFVDGAGTFHGGAIAPGAQMMLDGLHHGTTQLPQVKMARPDEAIGHNTAQAMLAGVYFGARGLVRELVERYAETVGVFPLVVATGGDAQTLFGDDPLVDRMVQELTLMGMALTFRTYASADS